MTSMCVKDGTEVEFRCPILNCDYLNWIPELDDSYYDDSDNVVNRFNATLSDGNGFEEISCDCSDTGGSYHALLMVTGDICKFKTSIKHLPVLIP